MATLVLKSTYSLLQKELKVIDESHKHIGHSGYKPEGETHFKIKMKATVFGGLTRLDMQRQVFKALSEEMESRIHALSLELSSELNKKK